MCCSNLHATTVTINTSQDADAIAPGVSPVSTLGGGLITLRSAIQYFNAANPGSNAINFDIPTSDPGYNATTNTWTLTPGIPLSDPFIGGLELDSIAVPLTINAYTFVGAVHNTATQNTLAQGDNAVLQIILNGSNYTIGDGQYIGNGLHFVAGSDGSIVRGLVINEWQLNGILIDGTNATINGIQILGNFIGTNATGTAVDSNRTGIGISGATNTITNTIIGTPAFADRNIISGSFGYMIFDGYYVRGGCITSAAGTGTLIQNNYIGTDTSGTVALGRSLAGVVFVVETSSTIGGLAANQRNIISGHAIYGVNLTNNFSVPRATFNGTTGCTNCQVQGNYIGTDVNGTAALGNSNAGITLDSVSTNNIIGGSAAGARNLISGNGNGLIPGSGVGIRLGQNNLGPSPDNIAQGNYIGVDVSCTKALPNTGFGVIVNDLQNTVIGNIVSGNEGGGVLIYGTNNALVTGNYIGTDISGTKKIPNGGNGIQLGVNGTLSCAALNNTIGS